MFSNSMGEQLCNWQLFIGKTSAQVYQSFKSFKSNLLQ